MEAYDPYIFVSCKYILPDGLIPTYYCVVSAAMKVILLQNKNCFFLPFFTHPGKFGLMHYKTVLELTRRWKGGAQVSNFGVTLFEMDVKYSSKAIYTFVVADSGGHRLGLRIKVATRFEISALPGNWWSSTASNGVKVYVGRQSPDNHLHPGHLVSWWFQCRRTNPIQLTSHIVYICRSAYGLLGTMPVRPCTPSSGHTTFVGLRGDNAQRVIPTPADGPGEYARYPYTRQQNGARFVPKAEKVINLLSNSASYSAGWIDPIMTGLLSVGVSDQEMIALCRLAILTFGRHGFGNTEHVDKGDLKKSADALSIIAKYLHEKDVEIRTKTEYAKTFIDRLGFGVPTTCGYQFVHDEDDEENDDFECFQYFVMPGLGICVRVRETQLMDSMPFHLRI